jgi:3-phosphoshikimate 1-carboxyvinyltransferase
LALQLECHIDGLHTLKIKETDRLQALKNEIQKLGSVLKITERSLTLERPRPLTSGALIDTYNDHRMAMAFAPLILKTNLFINDAEVVSKSFPDFWNNLRSLGLEIY